MANLAIGSYEAAALMGVHFTRPARMYKDGLIDGRALVAVRISDTPRRFVAYSQLSCEENFQEYDRKNSGRPRDWLHLRPDALKRLARAKPQVAYDDAVGIADAAKILGVHYTMVYKLIEGGKIVARSPWNPRRGGSRAFIVSRKSCEANRKAVAAQEKAGKKRGRKRKS
jgi:hypothetical protein